jgi:DNA-binding CsgD family transcriptional regulator
MKALVDDVVGSLSIDADRQPSVEVGVDVAAAWSALSADCGVAVLVVDETGKILFANDTAASMLGRLPREVLGTRYQDYSTLESGEERYALFQSVVTENQVVVLEHIASGIRRHTTLRPLGRDASGRGRVLMVCRPAVEGDFKVARAGIKHVRARVDDLGQLKSLTGREIEILKLIGSGLSTADIAKKLHRSVKTVEWHRVSLGTKLGVSNRVELAHIAIKAGMVDVHQSRPPEPSVMPASFKAVQ